MMELTIEQLKKFGNNEVIATGTGTYPEITDKEIRWVAVAGNEYYDWCIYALLSNESIEKIMTDGDKIFNESIIKRLVPCDDDAFGMYRF